MLSILKKNNYLPIAVGSTSFMRDLKHLNYSSKGVVIYAFVTQARVNFNVTCNSLSLNRITAVIINVSMNSKAMELFSFMELDHCGDGKHFHEPQSDGFENDFTHPQRWFLTINSV